MKVILGIEADGETLGVELGFEALQNVVYSIPDTEENAPIFAALAKHPNPSVRSNIGDKVNLDDETILLLAQDKDPNVNGRIPYSEAFKRIATLVSNSGGSITTGRPHPNLDFNLSSNPEISFGYLSQVKIICCPPSSKALKVWKSSS